MLSQEWTPPSACLWSQDAQVPGKSTISGQYRDLKDLFVGVLKVKIPDLRLLVEELKRVAQSSASIDDVKSLIWQINSFDPSIEDLETLRGSKLFPVRKANGRIELRTRMARFSVIDRQLWADAFEGKLDYLDFSLKEVRTLQPFLAGMKIGRYLSEVVIEKSSLQGIIPEPNAKRTRDLQRRAYALSRYVLSFLPPKHPRLMIIGAQHTLAAHGPRTTVKLSINCCLDQRCTKRIVLLEALSIPLMVKPLSSMLARQIYTSKKARRI